MAVGESPAVARYRLRVVLREARESKGLTQRQVAEALDWSLSKVNRIEGGEVTVSTTDLRALLQLYEIADAARVRDLLEHARTARRRAWWDQPEFREHLTPAMIASYQFEEQAAEIRSFRPTIIPGLLQTRAYATAILDFWSGDLSEADIATRLEVRMQRRGRIFSRDSAPKYLLILDESVLLREVGGPRVMSEQLYELLDHIRTGNIRVRVAPLVHPTIFLIAMFDVYTNDGEDVALYRERSWDDEIVYSPDTIRLHRELFERIWHECLSNEASAHLVEARAATLRTAAELARPDG
jgi:transcriptional regulator with XRE-family HTH domain